MQWIQLDSVEQIEELKKQSQTNTVLIFKHSTRCSTSRMALDRLERNWNAKEMESISPYFLDLISYRQVSNLIAESFGVVHESPQVILISNGKAYLDLSHFEIEYNEIKRALKN
jgi:bacillithiol system protein YtxJ